MAKSSFYKHPHALVEATAIGGGTRIWAFAHVLPGATIGRDCNICDGVFIENDVTIGDRVTVKCGVQLWDGICLEDDVFVGPNATFTNDPMPRSRQHLAKHPTTIVKIGASVGANATILPGLTIGPGAMVGAGAVVTGSVPAHAVVVGNPARIVRYIGAAAPLVGSTAQASSEETEARVDGVRLVPATVVKDLRGNLSAREVGGGLPFVPQRYFAVFDVPSQRIRGEHAHRECQQLLVAMRGTVAVVCDDGTNRQEFLLDSPGVGLLLPPLVWGIQYKYSEDALLLVMASHPYDPDDYIRDYETFLQERRVREEGQDR